MKDIKKDVSLKKYNTYKIGGIAKYLVEPQTIKKLMNYITYFRDNNIKFIVLGKGSNIILPDEDFDGAIIILNKLNKIKINKSSVKVQAGVLLNRLIALCVENSLQGLENLYGIPGTLGGAIVQNAGCFGSLISDFLEYVVYVEDDKVYKIIKKDCKFLYRTSLFKKDKNKIIVEAKFNLNLGNQNTLKNQMELILKKRKESQPLNYPNAGSTFKNPRNNYAGKLIESNNLKGLHINNAYVSEKHANFIINKGNCSSKDITNLIKKVQKIILNNEKIRLKLEQEIIKY